MGMDLSSKIANRRAEMLIQEMGIKSLPVDPFAIAEQHDIEVMADEAKAAGMFGCLVKVGNRFGIMYTKHIDTEGFQRFTVAHELGHYFLPGHSEALYFDEPHEPRSRSSEASPTSYEREANAFAAGLLMPSHLFVKAIPGAGEGFAAVKFLADACKTSFTATAIRYATYAEDPVAMIMSRGRTIHYCFMSEAIADIDGIERIRKGDPVPKGTVTFEFNRDARNVADHEKAYSWTTLSQWFDGAPEQEMKEDVAGLGIYNRTLTVLFTTEALEDEDERFWL